MDELLKILEAVDKTRLTLACICMLLDIITGTIGALINKDFKSTIFRQGLFKKLLEIVLIVVGYILDYTVQVEYIGVACIYLVIGMEAYSIVIENASAYIPIPEWLKTIIEDLKNGNHKVKENRGMD